MRYKVGIVGAEMTVLHITVQLEAINNEEGVRVTSPESIRMMRMTMWVSCLAEGIES